MKRILIKLSGEALANNSKENVFDPDFVDEVAAALATCAKEGYEIGVVVGAVILAGLYALFDGVILPTLEGRIDGMFDYSGAPTT